jgi:hypothetical protein
MLWPCDLCLLITYTLVGNKGRLRLIGSIRLPFTHKPKCCPPASCPACGWSLHFCADLLSSCFALCILNLIALWWVAVTLLFVHVWCATTTSADVTCAPLSGFRHRQAADLFPLRLSFLHSHITALLGMSSQLMFTLKLQRAVPV